MVRLPMMKFMEEITMTKYSDLKEMTGFMEITVTTFLTAAQAMTDLRVEAETTLTSSMARVTEMMSSMIIRVQTRLSL